MYLFNLEKAFYVCGLRVTSVEFDDAMIVYIKVLIKDLSLLYFLLRYSLLLQLIFKWSCAFTEFNLKLRNQTEIIKDFGPLNLD